METKMCFRFPFHDQGVGRVVFSPNMLGKGDNSPENSIAVEGKLKAKGNAIEGNNSQRWSPLQLPFRLFIITTIKMENP